MKKYLLSLFLVSTSGIIISVLNGDSNVHSNGTGAPTSNGCSCHGVTNNNDANSTIVLKTLGDTVVTTFNAGQTYKVFASITKASKVKYGFALSASDGTLNVASGDTKTQRFSNYITHTGTGTSFPSGIAEWEARWTAPATGSSVTLTAVFNASNNNGSDGGDVIYAKDATVTLSMPTAVKTASGLEALHVYPSVVKDYVQVLFNQTNDAPVSIQLIDMQGKVVSNLFNQTVQAGSFNQRLELSQSFPAGIYFINIQSGNYTSVKKVVIQ